MTVSMAVLSTQDCVQHCRRNGCSCDLKKGLWLVCLVFSRAGSFVLCDIVARQVQLADPHTHLTMSVCTTMPNLCVVPKCAPSYLLPPALLLISFGILLCPLQYVNGTFECIVELEYLLLISLDIAPWES